MKNKFLRSVIIIFSFLLSLYFPWILRNVFNITNDKFVVTSFGYPFTILIIIISLYILHKYNLTEIVSELGLSKGFGKGLTFGLLATLPMIVSSAILFKLTNDIFSFTILITVIIGPVMEEILFRGYLFGQLFNRERWGFIPASLIASVFFGIGHLYQSNTMSGLLAVFLVTFIGSMWNAWLFTEHNNNLWIPIWLHIFMNMSWTIFLIDVPGASGNGVTNLFRIITIIITVVYTIRYSRKHGFKINKKNLLIN